MNPLWMLLHLKCYSEMVNTKFTLRSVLWPHGRTMVTRRGLSALSSACRVWKRGMWGGGGGRGKWDLWTCPFGRGWMGHGCGAPPACFNKGTGGAEAETKTESKSWIIESALNNADVRRHCFSSRPVYKEKLISNTTPVPHSVRGCVSVWKQIRLMRFECFPSHGVQGPFEILQAPCPTGWIIQASLSHANPHTT